MQRRDNSNQTRNIFRANHVRDYVPTTGASVLCRPSKYQARLCHTNPRQLRCCERKHPFSEANVEGWS